MFGKKPILKEIAISRNLTCFEDIFWLKNLHGREFKAPILIHYEKAQLTKN